MRFWALAAYQQACVAPGLAALARSRWNRGADEGETTMGDMTRDGHEWTMTGWIWLSIGRLGETNDPSGFDVWKEVASRNGWQEDINLSKRQYASFKKAMMVMEQQGDIETVHKGRSRATSTWVQTEKGAKWWVEGGVASSKPVQGSGSKPRAGKWLTKVSDAEWDTLRRMLIRGEARVAVKYIDRDEEEGR